MSTYIVRITANGEDYELPFEGHEWAVEPGCFAPVQAWTAPKAVAETIASSMDGTTGLTREVTLTFGPPDDLKTAERVIYLGLAAHDDPQKRSILLTDVRWYLTRAWFCMDVNVRRRLGDKRLILGVLTDTAVVDSIGYAPWSIKSETDAYKWDEVRDVVTAYLGAARHGRPALTFVVDSFSFTVTSKIVQETVTDAPAAVGLAQAIESIPGAGIFVSLNGDVHVYDRKLGAEKTLVESLSSPLKDHGSLVWIDNSAFRAPTTRVYFDYELEVRWDFNPDPLGTWGDELVSALGFTSLENVLKVTDRSLDIPSGVWGAARTVAEGTWITFAEAYAAYGTVTYGPYTLPQLTDEIVAAHWFGDGLQRYTIGGAIASFDSTWAARISEIMRCFRTCFRAHKVTWERIRHAWAVRAAIWDPVTGTRAPSPVYCDFNITPIDKFQAAAVTVFGNNMTGFYPQVTGELENGQPSGFEIEIIDDELGIFEVVRKSSKFPHHSKLAISDIPQQAAVVGTGYIRECVLQRLNPVWSLATVISCSPAAPNDLRRLYGVPVTIADAASTAGLGSAPTAYGPDQETRCQLADARVGWEDTDPVPTNILLILLGAGVEDDDLLTPINLEQELIPAAKALAAHQLMSQLDHYEGSLAVPMTEVPVLGSISKIVYKVLDNRAVTVVHCSRQTAPFRAEDFLPTSARSYLLKEIATRR